MKFHAPSTKIIVCILLLLLAFAICAFLIEHFPSFGVLTDEKLLSTYSTNHESFEKLRQMITYDVLHDNNFNYPNFRGCDLDVARRQEYIHLVSKIDPDLTIGTGSTPVIYFIFSSSGIFSFGSDWEKGIVYAPNCYVTNGSVYSSLMTNGIYFGPQWIGNLSTSLDNARPVPAKTLLRPIGTNWFLIYYSED